MELNKKPHLPKTKQHQQSIARMRRTHTSLDLENTKESNNITEHKISPVRILTPKKKIIAIFLNIFRPRKKT